MFKWDSDVVELKYIIQETIPRSWSSGCCWCCIIPLGRSLTRSETFGRSVSSSVPLWFSEPGWVFTAVRRANLGQARDAIFDLVRRPHSFQVYHWKDETFKSHFRSKNMHKCVCGGAMPVILARGRQKQEHYPLWVTQQDPVSMNQ